MSDTTCRRSRRFRYSLRALLVLTAVVGLAFAWVHRARQQQLAVQLLRESNPGATVLYDGPNEDHSDSAFRAWTRRRLGVDYAATVTGVELFYPTDADLECVARLPRLEWLSLVRSVDLTDAGLTHLSRLNELRTLIISDAEQLTQAGLRQLGKLTSLQHLRLDLGRHAVSREAIESLRRALPNCEIDVGGASDRQFHLALLGR